MLKVIPMDYPATHLRDQAIGKAGSFIMLAMLAAILCCHPVDGACPGIISTGSLSINDPGNQVGLPIAYNYNSGSSVTISSISLTWPASKGNLKSVTLDNSIVWTGTPQAPTSVTLSSLSGSTSNRTINSGQTRTLWFNFQGQGGSGQLIGNSAVEGNSDTVGSGTAYAFPFTASASGTATKFYLYVGQSSGSAGAIVGIYSSNAAGTHPNTLLSSGSNSNPQRNAWNAITIDSVNLLAGTKYWLVIMGTKAQLRIKDRSSGGYSESSLQTNLNSLPSTWSTGDTSAMCIPSAYLTGPIFGSSSPSDYRISLQFSCGSSAGYPNAPASCSITGPDTVCDIGQYWYNASLTNMDSSYTYSYLWKVDSNSVATGQNAQINWVPYSSGYHDLYLNVTQTYGITTLYSECVKQVRVVKKPVVKITTVYQ